MSGSERAVSVKITADLPMLAVFTIHIFMIQFYYCTHSSEPNCGVQKAISSGLLSEDRLANYIKLKKEARYVGLNSKQIETEKISKIFNKVGGMKNTRKFIKGKNKNKRGF